MISRVFDVLMFNQDSFQNTYVLKSLCRMFVICFHYKDV